MTIRFATRPTRRSALRLLAGGLLGGVLAARGGKALAQRADSDNDGLYDDDETDYYGTDPFNPDTDGDGPDDGQEVYDGTDPLVNNNPAPAPEPPPAPAPAPAPAPLTCSNGLSNCGTYCAYLPNDRENCGICGRNCGDPNQFFCYQGNCVVYCGMGTRRCTNEIACRPYTEKCPGE